MPTKYKPRPLVETHCRQCGNLTSGRPNRKLYCSTPCKQKAYRKRKKGNNG